MTPVEVYVVVQVSLLGSIAIVGVYTDETVALRQANVAVNRRMETHQVNPPEPAP